MNCFFCNDQRGIRRAQSEKIIEESFDGSLPAFIAAFASRKKLSSADVAEIQKMIDAYREE